MASSIIRGQLMAAISELHSAQSKSYRDATFGGWTRETEAAHDRRADRIAALCRQLDALGEDVP
jgi:hypothetical protein